MAWQLLVHGRMRRAGLMVWLSMAYLGATRRGQRSITEPVR
jgi:hypothetical protein